MMYEMWVLTTGVVYIFQVRIPTVAYYQWYMKEPVFDSIWHFQKKVDAKISF